MTITSSKPLTSLTAELFDFLGLGPDLDLPRLHRVALNRRHDESGWRCTAHADEYNVPGAIEAVYGWAAYAGGTVHITMPYASTWQPSGLQISLKTRIVVAEVSIEIIANLDADAYAEAMAADREPVHAVGAFADLLIGGEVAAK